MIQSLCLEEPTVPLIHQGQKCGLLLTIQLRKLIIKTAKKVHVQLMDLLRSLDNQFPQLYC